MYDRFAGVLGASTLTYSVSGGLNAPPALRFWSWLAVFNRPEAALFPGVTVPIVVVAGVAGVWRRAGAPSEPRRRVNRWLVIGARVGVQVGLPRSLRTYVRSSSTCI